MAPLKILGDTLGRYQLLVPIGRGGMAEVFLGRLRGAAGFAKLVVIKRMHSHLSHDKRFIELFINEGRMVAQMSHPNICQVHELGEEAGGLFLVMEYLAGVPLDEVLRVLPHGTPHELPLLAGILGQACEGLHYAHQLRDRLGNPTPVIHRDVSPQNLFVTTDGICKVLDFGVAKMSTSDRFSQSGMIKGKLPYMAPEQIRGQRVDARTDVFAMGVVLWEALTGSRLFARPSDYLIWKAITEDPIPTLAQVRPDLPPAVGEVVRRALERAPAQRYQTMQALGQDLRRLAVPAPYETSTIAEALRTLCAERLAETSTIVDSALHYLEQPKEERDAAEEPSAAETLDPTMLPSVMLRDSSVVRSAPVRARRRRWPLVAAVTAAAGAAAIAAILLRQPAPTGAPAAGSGGLKDDLNTLGDNLRSFGKSARSLGDDLRGRDDGPADSTAGVTPGVTQDPTADVTQATTEETTADVTQATAEAPASAVAAAPPPEANPTAKPEAKSRTRGQRRNKSEPTSAATPSIPTTIAPKDEPTREATASAPGYYSVDSRPYAAIFIDGVAFGETPLYRVRLAPGSHQVRAVRADGTSKTYSISIAAGKEVSSGQLRW